MEQGLSLHVYINGYLLPETRHETYSESGGVFSIGSRVVTLEASAGDEIMVRTITMDGYYHYIYFCAEFIPKM